MCAKGGASPLRRVRGWVGSADRVVRAQAGGWEPGRRPELQYSQTNDQLNGIQKARERTAQQSERDRAVVPSHSGNDRAVVPSHTGNVSTE